MYPTMQMPVPGAAQANMYSPYQQAGAYNMGQGQPIMVPVPVQMMGPPGQTREPPLPGTDDTKVFVGGLLQTTSSAALGAYFAQFGPVLEARVVLDKVTGQSKRYAFVAFADAESATRAAASGHHVVEGKQCNVNLVSQKDQAMEAYKSDPANVTKRARDGEGDDGGESKRRRTSEVTSSANYSPYGPYSAGYPGGGGYASLYPGTAMPGFGPPQLAGRPGDPKIFVGNLASSTTDELLTMLLSVFGDVAEAKVIRDQDNNESKGFAFVTFVDPGAAARAASCGVLFIEGRRCTTNLASAKSKK